MAAIDPIRDFYKGAEVVIDLLARNRDGSVISSPASQSVVMTISATAGGTALVQKSASLTDASAGRFTIVLSDEDLEDLVAGRSYAYAIWSALSGASMMQAAGLFVLQPATAPA